MDLTTEKIYVSLHVIFDEYLFPYKNPATQNSTLTSITTTLPTSLIPLLPHALLLCLLQVLRYLPYNLQFVIYHQYRIIQILRLFHQPSLIIVHEQPETANAQPLQHSNTHAMITQSKNNIWKPKTTLDGRVMAT